LPPSPRGVREHDRVRRLCEPGRTLHGRRRHRGRAPQRGSNTFTASGLAAAAGLAGIEPETLVSFAGERVITTRRGTLTLHAVGVFDTAPSAAGEFSELEKVIGGTGRFAAASGTLHLFGQATLDGTGFEGAIVGEICRLEDP
jgi:hypothetical protein